MNFIRIKKNIYIGYNEKSNYGVMNRKGVNKMCILRFSNGFRPDSSELLPVLSRVLFSTALTFSLTANVPF